MLVQAVYFLIQTLLPQTVETEELLLMDSYVFLHSFVSVFLLLLNFFKSFSAIIFSFALSNFRPFRLPLCYSCIIENTIENVHSEKNMVL